MTRLQAAGACGGKVRAVGRHHHAVSGRKIESRAGREWGYEAT